jgi:hypothetical protein
MFIRHKVKTLKSILVWAEKKGITTDSWTVHAHDGKIIEGMQIAEAFKLKEKHPDSTIAVVHSSLDSGDPNLWMHLAGDPNRRKKPDTPFLRKLEQKRKAKEAKLNPQKKGFKFWS